MEARSKTQRRLLTFGAVAFPFSIFCFILAGSWSTVVILTPLAASFALMAAGVPERSRSGRWLNYGMLAASWVALGYNVFV